MVDEDPINFIRVPYCFKTQKMCDKVFNKNPQYFEYIYT